MLDVVRALYTIPSSSPSKLTLGSVYAGALVGNCHLRPFELKLSRLHSAHVFRIGSYRPCALTG